MKRFNKVFLLILAFVCVMSLASCGEDEPEYEDASRIYRDAKEKTDSLKAFRAQMTAEHILKDHEYVSKDLSESVIRYNNTDELVIFNEYNNTFTLKDSSTVENSRSMYYKDNTVYEKLTDAKKYIYAVADENVSQLADSYSSIALDIPEKAFEKSVVEKGDITSVTADAEYETVKDFIATFTGDMTVYYSPVNEEFDYSYSDIKLGFKVNKEGCFSEMTVDFTVSFEALEGQASVDVKVKIGYSDDISIEEPADLSEYIPYTGEEEKSQEELEQIYMDEVFALFDSDYNRIDDFNKRYVELCIKYNKAAIDSMVDTIEMAKLMQE